MKQLNFFVGTVGSEIRSGSTNDDNPWTSFRIAVNHDRFDNSTGAYSTVDTTWFEVSCYGALATNTRVSIHKGDSVIVVGRIRAREWTSDDGRSGTAVQIVAENVGHNLRFWPAQSARPQKPSSASQTQATEETESSEDAIGRDSSPDGGIGEGVSEHETQLVGVGGVDTTVSADQSPRPF